MKKVLFIAYQFPPRGGPGVHRSLNFVKYLRDYGYDPIVLTVNETDIKRSGYIYDDTLLKQIQSDITVIRTPSYEPIRLINFLMKMKIYRIPWFFCFPLFWERPARWPFKTYRVAAELITKNDIKIVYTSSSPYSALLLGKMLQKRFGIKWVADLRDPFTDGYGWQWPSKLHWRWGRMVEKKVLQKPDMLIVNTPETKKLYLQRKITNENRITVLTNGF